VGEGETLSSLSKSLSEVTSQVPSNEKVSEMLTSLNNIKYQNLDTSMSSFAEIVEIMVPQFMHEASTKSLDNRL